MKRLFSIAPMMDYTDRHYRYLARLLSPNAWLYTEMIHAVAVLRGETDKLLAYDEGEHPLVLQLGGSDPVHLARAAKIAEDWGFDEVNLNAGCPSHKVQQGKFGACLMKEPQLVAQCVDAMQNAVKIPVTVKTRLGIDEQDSLEFLMDFIDTVSSAGCRSFILHARKAWLKGLNPKQNRSVPPLQYDRVYAIKNHFPALEIIINGGIETCAAIEHHLHHVDGVMCGRKVYHQPWLLAEIEQVIYGRPLPTIESIFEKMYRYIEKEQRVKTPLHHIARHLQGLMLGRPYARKYRQEIHLRPLETLEALLAIA